MSNTVVTDWSLKTLDEIDTMTLQQALLVADDWIDDLSFLGEDGGDVHANLEVPKKPVQRRKLDSKARRRRQLQELRVAVKSLEGTLMFIRANLPGETDEIREATILQRVYEKSIADRESHARLKAQARNLHLRRLAYEYRRDALKIKQLGRRLLALTKSYGLHAFRPRSPFVVFREDPQRQLLRLSALQEDADRMFERMIVDQRLGERQISQGLELQDVSGADGAIQVVFTCAWLLPFTVQEVANASWNQMTRVETGSGKPKQWLDIHADTSYLVSQFMYTSAHDVNDFFKCGQIATCRETLANDTIQLVSTIHVKAIEENTIVGNFQSDVWTRIVPIPTTTGLPLTQVLWCRRRRLQILPSQNQTPWGRTRWKHDTVSSPIQEHEETILTRNQQSVENSLLSGQTP